MHTHECSTQGGRVLAPLNQAVACALEPALYHRSGRGYFAICELDVSGKFRQRTYPTKSMADVLAKGFPISSDIWISMASFSKKKSRKADDAARICVVFSDIDFYKIPELAGQSPNAVAELILAWCVENAVPEPTLIIASGRGLQVKWVLRSALPKAAFRRWSAVQEHLCQKLAHFGADPKAIDIARVLRLAGTTHKKTGKVVKVIHHARVPTPAGVLHEGWVLVDFEELALRVLPFTREQVRAHRIAEAARREARKVRVSRRRKPGKRRRAKTTMGAAPVKGSPLVKRGIVAYCRKRFADLERLVELRGWKSGAPSGDRNTMVLLAAVFQSRYLSSSRLPAEVAKFAKIVAPTWGPGELKSCISAVIEKKRRYDYTTERIIEMLRITKDEQRVLAVLIDGDEVATRHRDRENARRRAMGLPTREELLRQHEDRRRSAIKMRSAGAPWGNIAAVLGYPSSDAARVDCRRR